MRYSKVKVFVLMFTLIMGNYFWAQIGMGQWRMHVASAQAIDVAVVENTVFTAFKNGVFVYNSETEEQELLTDINGLSDINVSTIYYDEVGEAVLVGYENGNIDKITSDNIYNIPAIKLAQIPNSKRINRFERYGDYVYVATDFCVSKLDVDKDEIKDTYYPTNGNDAILDISFSGDTIFALSATMLKYGLLTNPALPDESQWQIDNRLPVIAENEYSEIEMFQNKQMVLFKKDGYGMDSVFYLNENGLGLLTDSPFSLEINSINILNDTLFAVNMDGAIYMYDETLSNSASYNSNNMFIWISPLRTVLNSQGVWSADKTKGLFLFTSGIGYKRYPIVGPYNNDFYSMDWQEDKLAIASGRLNGKLPSFSRNGIHLFENENWEYVNVTNVEEWENKNIWDFIDIAVNPKNTDEVAIATYSEEPLSVLTSDTVKLYTDLNSTIELTESGNGWSLVSSVLYDPDGNLWALNGYTDKPLNVKDENGQWINFDCGGSARNVYTKKMIIDFNDQLWFATESKGLFGYNYNGTLSDPGDDQYVQLSSGSNSGNLPSDNVTAIAADFDGEIWIGTDAGFAILYNASNAFGASPGEYDAQRVKVSFEGNVEYVLGSTHITDIEVDGGNRKWMATANAGILLLSPDGSEILEQFTVENSPLISNNIFDLKLDQSNGELYIITDKGLVSYRSDASYEDPTYEDFVVFPNPVRPNFSGPVTIQGIRYNSDVKITDAAGNLVYKTTSNGGTATWDCNAINGEPVVTGVYFIWTATNAGKDKKVGKVLVIK